MLLGSISEYLNIFEYLRKFYHWLWTWKFKQIFGVDAGRQFYIIYSIHNAPSRSDIFSKPKPKVERSCYRAATNLTTINSCALTRGIGHLVYGFGEKIKIPPIISSDTDTDENMDISFISMGGVTNFKTCDLLEDTSNIFLDFDLEQNTIVHKASKLPIVKAECDIDYGFIVKIHPRSNFERTWICCDNVRYLSHIIIGREKKSSNWSMYVFLGTNMNNQIGGTKHE